MQDELKEKESRGGPLQWSLWLGVNLTFPRLGVSSARSTAALRGSALITGRGEPPPSTPWCPWYGFHHSPACMVPGVVFSY